MGLPDAESVSDIQRLYMILAPTARTAGPPEDDGKAPQAKPKARLIVIAKKVLTDPSRRERFFGFVSVRTGSLRAVCAEKGRPGLGEVATVQRCPGHDAGQVLLWLFFSTLGHAQ